jgi:hypothetical protein
MKATIIILILSWVVFFGVKAIRSIKHIPTGYETIDRGSYELVLGSDAKQIFFKYRVSEMHGLSLQGAENRIAQGGSYIDGLCNYHPYDKNLDMSPRPFLFLNIGSIQNNYSNHQRYLVVMHECMHMAGRLYGDRWDSHEEDMITWAEKEADLIIKILKEKKYL